MLRLGAALLFLASAPMAGEEGPASVQPAPRPSQFKAYVPLTAEERWNDYLRRSYSPQATGARIGRSALTNLWSKTPPEWHGAEGYGKRVASDVTRSWFRRGVESAGAAALGHDPRYVPCLCGNPLKRVAHAFSQSVLTYDNKGNRVFGYARVGSRYTASMLETTWFPDRYSWKDGFREGSQSFVSVGVFNIAREFWPDIRSKLRRKKN